MKKIFILLMTVGILCGCQGTTNENSQKIGVILPLTGDLSFLGNFMRNSMLLNAKGDDVQFIFEDCGGESKQAVLAVNKLVNIDKVSAIVSSVSYLSEAINPVLEAQGIPHFILSFSPRLSKEKNVIQPFVSSMQEAEMFVKYIEENNISSVAFLRHQEPDATYAYDNYTKLVLDSMNVSIVDVVFNNKTIRDFKNDILKIKASNAELLIIQSLAYNIPNIINAINTYDLRIPLLGDLNFLDIPHKETCLLVEGIPFIGLEFLESKNYDLYEAAYISEYDSHVFALGAFACDISALLQNPTILQDSSKDEIIKRLNDENGKVKTISNQSNFNNEGELVVNYSIMEYHNAKVRKVK